MWLEWTQQWNNGRRASGSNQWWVVWWLSRGEIGLILASLSGFETVAASRTLFLSKHQNQEYKASFSSRNLYCRQPNCQASCQDFAGSDSRSENSFGLYWCTSVSRSLVMWMSPCLKQTHIRWFWGKGYPLVISAWASFSTMRRTSLLVSLSSTQRAHLQQENIFSPCACWTSQQFLAFPLFSEVEVNVSHKQDVISP